jgi:hypothetical protein
MILATFVPIPGRCHGGWSYEPLTEQLRLHGHRVHPLTLTGLSERSHLLNAGVNLETHIQEVVSMLASLLQPIRLTGDLARFRRRDYVYATGCDGESPRPVRLAVPTPGRVGCV